MDPRILIERTLADIEALDMMSDELTKTLIKRLTAALMAEFSNHKCTANILEAFAQETWPKNAWPRLVIEGVVRGLRVPRPLFNRRPTCQ